MTTGLRVHKVEVVGKVGRGRGRKTWLQCVNSGMKDLGLRVGEAQDRQLWRRKIFGVVYVCLAERAEG